MQRIELSKAMKKRLQQWRENSALLRVKSKEWDAAWQALGELSGDHDFVGEDPESGEVWQYMGSVRRLDAWWHEFRHRWHPRKQRRLMYRVLATRGWQPDHEKPKVTTVTRGKQKRRVIH